MGSAACDLTDYPPRPPLRCGHPSVGGELQAVCLKALRAFEIFTCPERVLKVLFFRNHPRLYGFNMTWLVVGRNHKLYK